MYSDFSVLFFSLFFVFFFLSLPHYSNIQTFFYSHIFMRIGEIRDRFFLRETGDQTRKEHYLISLSVST